MNCYFRLYLSPVDVYKACYSYWLQVTHILNVAYGVENAFPDLFIYKTLSILDLPDTDIISHLYECAQFIDQAKAEVRVLTWWIFFLHTYHPCRFYGKEGCNTQHITKVLCNWNISISQSNFLSVDSAAYLILDRQSVSARLLSSPTAA